jgi:hypothetical protein
MQDNFEILIKKLNAFIKKYYKNQIIRGVLISLTGILFLFLFVDFIEYFAWMGKTARLIVFYASLLIILSVLFFQVIIPFLKLMKIGKTISYEEAARIIGKYFPEVDDKLVNVLQLKTSKAAYSKEDLELLLASVSQKSIELKPIPFSRAVDFKKNLKYLKYFIPVTLLILILLLVYPSFIIEPSKRIVNYEKHYDKPLPYSIKLLNDSLYVLQHDDFNISVLIKGDEIPKEVFITSNGYKYKMYPSKTGIFEYTFKDVNKDIVFNISTEKYFSEEYRLKVFPKPIIYSFDVILKYPAYLKKKQDKISGLGDLIVPEGTELEWRIHTKDVSQVTFILPDTIIFADKIKENTFIQKYKAVKSFNYLLLASNKYVSGIDTLNYYVQTIKDEYPSITLKEFTSKEFIGFVQLSGTIRDDYGFHSLKFIYKKENDSLKNRWNFKQLDIDKNITEQYYNYSLQLTEMGLEPGEGINYYLEVRDNDAPHGYKAMKSSTGYVSIPDPDEMEQMKDSTSDEIKDELANKIKELEELNKKLDELQLDFFEKKELNWADKKKLEELLKKEQDLHNKLEELEKLNKEIQNLEETLKQKMDPDLQQRLEELQKMFEELKDENMQEELKKIQKELNKLDKDKLNKMLDKMKQKNEILKENLEQNLELYKQMEVEKKVEEAVEKLQELAKKQKELAEKTKNDSITKEQSLKEQKEIEKQFEELDKKLDEVKELDKKLKEPFNLKKDTAAVNKVKKEMNEAKKKLNDDKKKKASENQKNASDKMKKMAENMESSMMSIKMQRTGEDMEMVKRLLDNLVDLSFRQESIMKTITKLSTKDPKFVTVTQNLNDIKDEFKIIQDSLRAIGKRQVMIRPFIIRETRNIELSLNYAIKKMADRRKGESLGHQQFAMTHMNNLALMLDESLEQMKNSMSMSSSSSKTGQQACPNPGENNRGDNNFEQIMEMQKELSDGLKQQGKGQQNGQQESNGNNSEEWGDSEKLAKMAALQYQIRLQLQKYLDELKKEGQNGKSIKDIIEEMKKNEEDIINRRITQETIERQKDIEVRLLKAKEAKLQREKEKRREAKEGKNRHRKQPPDNIEFNKIKKAQEDILFLKPIKLNYYFNSLYKRYIYKLEIDTKTK